MIPSIPHVPFTKIPRLYRPVIITEKIDGTNSLVYVDDDLNVFAGSRNRWIEPGNDNFGFAAWVESNTEELRRLGPGLHYGEWWGHGIQRGYGLPPGERHWSLFNVNRWGDPDKRPVCCDLVPVLYRGDFTTLAVETVLDGLRRHGSLAAPFMNPEGIVVYHIHANLGFKVTLQNDDVPKSEAGG